MKLICLISVRKFWIKTDSDLKTHRNLRDTLKFDILGGEDHTYIYIKSRSRGMLGRLKMRQYISQTRTEFVTLQKKKKHLLCVETFINNSIQGSNAS